MLWKSSSILLHSSRMQLEYVGIIYVVKKKVIFYEINCILAILAFKSLFSSSLIYYSSVVSKPGL